MDALKSLIYSVVQIYIYLLIASAVLSWLVHFKVINTQNRLIFVVGDFLYRITEPALAPIRRLIGQMIPGLRGIDISPIVLILALVFVRDLILDNLF